MDPVLEPLPRPFPGPVIELPCVFPRPLPRLERILVNFDATPGPQGLDEMAKDLTARLAAADAADSAEAALKALLGDLPVILPFVLPDARVFSDTGRFKHSSGAELTHWLEDSAMVREGLEAVSDLSAARAQDLGRVALQWDEDGPKPPDPDTDWIGGPLTEDDA